MAHIDPLPPEALGEFADRLGQIEAATGFVPNSLPTMARVPGLVDGFGQLAGAVFGNGLIEPGLAQMVAHMASAGSGCRYCQAHTSHNAERMGVDEAKIAALWEFETDDAFDAAERAALRLALHSGQSPNAATAEDFEACRAHYTDDQITAIVAVCALFGYLNRWNDTMATDLEAAPRVFAEQALAPHGWEVGRHAG